jgi:hypothetical protein
MLVVSGVAVPDMPLTSPSFISIHYFWLFLKETNTNKAAVFAGIFLGLLFCGRWMDSVGAASLL